MRLFSPADGSKLRNAFRAVLVLFTAFGLQLDAEQVAAIQLAAEAFLAIVVKDREA